MHGTDESTHKVLEITAGNKFVVVKSVGACVLLSSVNISEKTVIINLFYSFDCLGQRPSKLGL